jgi:hypothetical protein
VLFLTTVFNGTEFELRIRRKPTTKSAQSRLSRAFFGNEDKKVVSIPTIAAAYNDEMGAVDLADQLRASQRYDHRICRGGWQALAWTFLLETAIINSFKLQTQKLGCKPSWKPYEIQSQWRLQLINELVEAYAKTGTTRKRYRSGDTFTPVAQHKRVFRGKEANCAGCQGLHYNQIRSRSSKRPALKEITKNTKKRPTKTTQGCDQCDVAICSSDNCWYSYHTPI